MFEISEASVRKLQNIESSEYYTAFSSIIKEREYFLIEALASSRKYAYIFLPEAY